MPLPIVVVTEGESDIRAIPILLGAAGARVGRALKFGGQGVECTIPMLVERRLLPVVRIATLGLFDRVIVVLDREGRDDCPGDFAQRVGTELLRQLRDRFGYLGSPPVHIVCADRCLENWLIADPEGLRSHAYISRNLAARVGNNADGKNALAIIKGAFRSGSHYHKARDAPRLATKVRIRQEEVRNRSSSLDKLLRTAGV